ncbi:MAG: sugar ABC transporter permease [Clostridia bacterium]|nr:sugar ABC transporter permease [Clostridia bacterium]
MEHTVPKPVYKKDPPGVRFVRAIRQFWPLYLMLVPGMLFFAVYKYAPMYGIQIAFKNFSLKKGISGSPWLWEDGKQWFYWFQRFFKSPANTQIITNTLVISIGKLIAQMIPPLIFALAISETVFKRYARVIQTVSYLPHFLSWVIIFGICTTMLGESSGVVNNIIKRMGGDAIPFLSNKNYIRGVLIGTSLWQGLGWSSIVYLAAIAGIDTSMYEAAIIDGCGRFRKIWYITLPNLGRIFVVLLITKVGRILDGGFEQVYIFLNDRVSSTAQIIDTWVYTQGLGKQQYSLTTAVGLLKSVLSCGLVLGTNALARKWDSSLW